MKLSKRINRKNYILFFIASTLFTAILGTLLQNFGVISLGSILTLNDVQVILYLIFLIYISICRLQDRGRTGFWIFLFFAPVIGQIILFRWLFLDPSNSYDNQYGESFYNYNVYIHETNMCTNNFLMETDELE